MLRRICGPKRNEVTGEWMRSLTDVYSSPNIIQVVKLKGMRWTGHVACVEERRDAYKALVGKPEPTYQSY